MHNLMSLHVEELESLDAATETPSAEFWEGVAVGIVVGTLVALAIT